MIDIRKQPALIECINMVLTPGHRAIVQKEKDGNVYVIGVEEQRKVVGKFDAKSLRSN